jgi:hypothetical protein
VGELATDPDCALTQDFSAARVRDVPGCRMNYYPWDAKRVFVVIDCPEINAAVKHKPRSQSRDASSEGGVILDRKALENFTSEVFLVLAVSTTLFR